MKIIASPSRELKNKNYMRWSRQEALRVSLLRMRQSSVKAACAWMLLPLALSQVGCATQSALPCKQPEPLPPIVLSEPLPLESYLLQSQRSDENSLKRLTDMSSTFKH